MNFILDSQYNSVNDTYTKAHLRLNFDKSLIFDHKKFIYEYRLIGLKIPYVFKNISSTNGTLKYTVDGTQYTITLPTGFYGTDTITSGINYYLYNNDHYYFNSSTNLYEYPFSIGWNPTTTKSYIGTNAISLNSGDTYYGTEEIDISSTSSDFYKVLGFASTSVLSGSTLYISPNDVDIDCLLGSSWYIRSNIAYNNYNDNRLRDVIMSFPYVHPLYPNPSDSLNLPLAGPQDNVWLKIPEFLNSIPYLEFKLTDIDGNLIDVETDATDSSTVIQLQIRETKK